MVVEIISLSTFVFEKSKPKPSSLIKFISQKIYDISQFSLSISSINSFKEL